jgi:hypothetical protein
LGVGGLPAGTVNATTMASTLNLSDKTLTLPANLTTGLVKTGSLTVASGSGRTYLDIANCFTSTYDDYIIFFHLFNDANLTTSTGLMAAIEAGGASIGVDGLFSGGNFVSGHSHNMRFGQTGTTSNNGSQGENFDWAKILGTGDNGNTICRFSGLLQLRNVYSSEIKTGNSHGVMYQSSTYDEISGFRSLNSYAGRGLRMWYGQNITANGSISVNSYGTIRVYGVSK